jgi:L-fuculose-phosphate aldolase/L-ribulose-5-phosphate 4-epimerase
MSVRFGDDAILVKPTKMSNIECSEASLLSVRLDGTIIAGDGRPTRDIDFHLSIYRARADVGGIIHSHAPWATAVTFGPAAELPLVTAHALEKLGRVPVIKETPCLAGDLGSAFGDGARAVLLDRHGIVAAAASLTAAEELAELVEETAQIAILVRLRPDGGDESGR